MSLELNTQFQYALDLLENSKKHLFITGKAGTGKSTLLTYFRGTTKKNHTVLAPTGAAAVNVSGQTIHSFFYFSPGTTHDDAKREGKKQKNNKIYKNLEMIVIDEISMVRADLFDCIDIFLKEAKQTNEPFGGIQMIMIGDLYQLPPVMTRDEQEIFTRLYRSPYFFDALAFQRISQYDDFYEKIELQKIYRQSDQEFIELLNSIRNKQLHKTNLSLLNERTKLTSTIDDASGHIYLVSTNKQAEEINNTNLEKLRGHYYTYRGKVFGDFESKSLPTDNELKLKKGARVMFLNNDSEGRWINGTLGEVLGFYEDDRDAEPIIEVKIDKGEIVEVSPITWTNYQSTYNEETKKIERSSVGTYTQIPLKCAWAITIHKSQGKTFDKVIIDIGWGAFASGQIYVALSRCKTLEGIVLKKPIQYKHILLDDRIKQFFAQI